MRIDDASVAEHSPSAWTILELLHNGGDLVARPNIVLIGKENEVTGRAPRQYLKISHGTEALVVDLNVRRELTVLQKGPNEFRRAIGGRVVIHKQFVGRMGLIDHALELLLYISASVVGSQHDTDPGMLQSPTSALTSGP